MLLVGLSNDAKCSFPSNEWRKMGEEEEGRRKARTDGLSYAKQLWAPPDAKSFSVLSDLSHTQAQEGSQLH